LVEGVIAAECGSYEELMDMAEGGVFGVWCFDFFFFLAYALIIVPTRVWQTPRTTQDLDHKNKEKMRFEWSIVNDSAC
jgi:hypothetical protein